MTAKSLEEILDEASCIDLSTFPQFMLNFQTKEAANNAQKALFEYFEKREIHLVFEYQEHSAKLNLYDVEFGNDVSFIVPFCEDEQSIWFDNKTFDDTVRVMIFCGYGKIKEGSRTRTPMADYIQGLDEAGIRNIKHFTAKWI
jgi:hypothetical protein